MTAGDLFLKNMFDFSGEAVYGIIIALWRLVVVPPVNRGLKQYAP
jgi:hypothetical protein